jgi:hypothetical protein
VLALFDLGVIKLFHLAAVQAHQVVMVLAFVEFINRFAAFELAAAEQTGLLKLGQHPVDRGQADVEAVPDQQTRNTSSAVMWRCVPRWKISRIFRRGSRGLEACAFEFVDVGHGVFRLQAGLTRARCRYNELIISFCPTPCPTSLMRSAFCRACRPWLGLRCVLAVGCVWPVPTDCAAVSAVHHRPVQDRCGAGQRGHARTGGSSQDRHDRVQVRGILGTPLLDQRVPRRPLGLCVHFQAPGAAPCSRAA